MPSSTRGRQPAHVYKRRRLVVLTVAVLLVLGFGRLLSGSSDGSDGESAVALAAQAVADASPTAEPSTQGKGKKDGKGKGKGGGKGGKGGKGDKNPTPTPTPTPTPPAEPSGPCPDADVLVTPSVPAPVAGRDVAIVLNLQMGTTEACTWRVSSDSVTLKIYAAADDVWTSQDCPGTIPAQDVVLRRESATPVTVLWSSKRSDEFCSDRTAWVLPGLYNVAAAAFEGEPTDVTFELTAPAAPVVTQTAEPTQKPDKGDKTPQG